MKPPIAPALLLLAATAACVAPMARPTLAELNQRWAGQTWAAYQEAHGKPAEVAAQPGGGLVATYRRIRSRMVSSPSSSMGTAYAVNPRTGERLVVHPGSSPDVAGQLVTGGQTPAAYQGLRGGTGMVYDRCITAVHVDAQGRIQRIEQQGNDCR